MLHNLHAQYHGHDENGNPFTRVRDAYCLSSIKEYLTYKGII